MEARRLRRLQEVPAHGPARWAVTACRAANPGQPHLFAGLESSSGTSEFLCACSRYCR